MKIFSISDTLILYTNKNTTMWFWTRVNDFAKWTGTTAAAAWTALVSAEALTDQTEVLDFNSTNQLTRNVKSAVDEILESTTTFIWELAPLASHFLSEIDSAVTTIANGGWITGWVAWAIWAGAGYIGSKVVGWVTNTKSKTDETIATLWWWLTGMFSVVWATDTAMTIVVWTVTYVVARKVWEKLLSEYYANITAWVATLAATWMAWGYSPESMLWTVWMAGAATLGIKWLSKLWKSIKK